MNPKESYEARIGDIEGKFKNTNNGQSPRLMKKKIVENQAIIDYIEKIYSQEIKTSETLSRKTTSLSELEQKYSHY